jgi:hypothetical protein
VQLAFHFFSSSKGLKIQVIYKYSIAQPLEIGLFVVFDKRNFFFVILSSQPFPFNQ